MSSEGVEIPIDDEPAADASNASISGEGTTIDANITGNARSTGEGVQSDSVAKHCSDALSTAANGEDEEHAVEASDREANTVQDTTAGNENEQSNAENDRPMTKNVDISCGQVLFKCGEKAPVIKQPPTDFFPSSDTNSPATERLGFLLKLSEANGRKLEFEANWIVQRMNWLLLSQTFLLLSYVTALLDCGTCDGACQVLQKFRFTIRVLALAHTIIIGFSIAAAASVAAELNIVQSKYDKLITYSIREVGKTSDVLWLTLNIGRREGTGVYDGSIVGFFFRFSCFIGDWAKWIVLATLIAAWVGMFYYEKNTIGAQLNECELMDSS